MQGAARPDDRGAGNVCRGSVAAVRDGVLPEVRESFLKDYPDQGNTASDPGPQWRRARAVLVFARPIIPTDLPSRYRYRITL